MTKISAVIVAHNEEDRIQDCLKSLVFVDEIVVVLDKCSDKTTEIAKYHTKNVIEGSWEIEGQRRNAGLEAASNEWILEIDADERISKELANEIIDKTKEQKHDCYQVNLDNYLGNRHIKHGWMGYLGIFEKIILFKKGVKKYHEVKEIYPDFDISGQQGKLINNLTHIADNDITSLVNRFNHKTTLNANDIIKKNLSYDYSLLRNLYSIKLNFFQSYIQKKGYKEGIIGIIIAILCGLYQFTSRLKAKEIINNKNNEDSQPNSN